MNKFLISIIITLIIVCIFVFCLKNTKKDAVNKVLFFLVFISIFGAVFYLVCFPRGENANDVYFSGISQMVGGLFTVIGVYFTIKEEERNRKYDDESFDKKIKEQLRLENLPVLKFDSNDKNERADGVFYYVDCTDEVPTKKLQLNINMKNVGLGSAQNISFQIIIGIENDESKTDFKNLIIEPSKTITHTVYFCIPDKNIEFNRRLTILVFYEDLLNNRYVQKLEGNIGNYCCEDGIEYNSSVDIYDEEPYQIIGSNFKYEIPEEIILHEKERLEFEKRMEDINKNISNREEIDELVNDYLSGKKSFYSEVKEYFKNIKFEGSGGGLYDYKVLKRNVYLVTVFDEAGVNYKERIRCFTELKVNIKTEEVKILNKKITNSISSIKKRRLKKFQRKIDKDLRKTCESERDY